MVSEAKLLEKTKNDFSFCINNNSKLPAPNFRRMYQKNKN